MPNNEKTAAEEKIRIVELYLSGKIGYSESGKRAGVDRKTIARWASRYKTEGPAGFLTHGDNRAYGRETKPSAVLNYLAGKGSLQEICERHGVRDTRQHRDWLRVYHRHENFRIHTGGSRMTKGRDTTTEERMEIVKTCIANGNDYGGTALKYRVSCRQVYTWTREYLEMGVAAGLEDRQGHRDAAEPDAGGRTERQDRPA